MLVNEYNREVGTIDLG